MYPDTFWSLMITNKFDIAADIYVTVPLSTFSANENNACSLYLQLLVSDDEKLNNTMVFGSMWLQNFIAYYEYDYSGVDNTNKLSLFMSKTYALPGADISR